MGVAWSGVGSVSASVPVVRQRHDKTARRARDARRAGGKAGFLWYRHGTGNTGAHGAVDKESDLARPQWRCVAGMAG